MNQEVVTAENERREVEESIAVAKEINVALYDIIERYKDRPHIIAKAHICIVHAILRNSVCCLSSLAVAIMGVWSVLEPIIAEGRYDLPDPPTPGRGN